MSDDKDDDGIIEDEDLLQESARHAIRIGCHRNKFMTLAKRAWYTAATEAGQNPQTVGVKLRPPRQSPRPT